MQTFLFVLFLVGYSLACVLGTNTGVGAAGADETNMLFQWPGYLALGLVAVLALFKWRVRLPHAPCELCLLAGAFLVAYLSCRGLFSPVYKARMDTSLALATFIAFALSASLFSHPTYRRAWFWLTAVLVVVNFIVVVVHLAGNETYFILPGYDRPAAVGGGGRAGGLFIDPNHLGCFMLLFLFPALGLCFFGGGRPLKRIFLFLLALVAMVSIGASASRGALLAAGVGMVLFFVLSLYLGARLYRDRFARVLVTTSSIGVGISALGWFLASRFVGGRYQGFHLGEVFTAFGDRKWYWWAAYEQFKTAPLIGTGSRTFDSYWREFRPLGTPPWLFEARFAHSEYLQLLGDYGLLGILLMVFFLAACVVHCSRFLQWFCSERVYQRRVSKGSMNLGLALGALCAAAALIVASAFEFPMHLPAVAIPAAVLLGILANPGFKKFSYRPIRKAGLRAIVKSGVAVAGCCLLYGGIRYLPAEYLFERSRFAEAENRPELERINLINRAKKHDPYNPLIFYHGGVARMNMLSSRMSPLVSRAIAVKAREDFATAVALDSRDVYSRIVYLECLDWLGLTAEADRLSEETIKLAPINTNIRISHARHLLRMGRWDEAEAFYRSVGGVSRTMHDTSSVHSDMGYIREQRALEQEAGQEK